MAIEQINLGTIEMDGADGDVARLAFTKVNNNFGNLDDRVVELEINGGKVKSINNVQPDSSGNININAGSIGAATAEQGAKADTAIQPETLNPALDGKVDKVSGYGLSQEDFTTELKNKLDGLDDAGFVGFFESLVELETSFPTGTEGEWAFIDQSSVTPISVAVWSTTLTEWQVRPNGGGGGSMTPSEIKIAYESNANTNAFTDAEKSKLGGIEVGAQVNVATNLSKLVESNSTTINSSTGAGVVLDLVTTSLSGLMSPIDKQKLNELNIFAIRVDVRDLGCILDSPESSVTNTTIIQNALNSGIALFFPEDSICYVESINLPSRFWISGTGTISWKQENKLSLINMLNSIGNIDYGLIEGVSFRGNRPSQTTPSSTGHDAVCFYLRSGSVRDLTFKSVNIYDFGDGAMAGGAVVMGALSGTNNVIDNISFINCKFTDISNIPGVYIDSNAEYHTSLSRIKVTDCKFVSNVPARYNQLYILGPSTTVMGFHVEVIDNWFETSQEIDCFTELNHIQDFNCVGNTNVLRETGKATALLIRDNCLDGDITRNRYFNFGTSTNISAISLTRLSAGTQSLISIHNNKFFNWGAGNGGSVINLGAGCNNITINNNNIRSGAAGRIQTAFNIAGNFHEIFNNNINGVNYVLNLTSNSTLIRFEENRMVDCGDGVVGTIVSSVLNLQISYLSIKNNILYTVRAGTPNFVSVSSSLTTENRIENNTLPTGVNPSNQSYSTSFVIVTRPAAGAILSGRVFRMGQGGIGIGPGDGFIIGANLDATLDGYGASTVVIGDTVIVSPPGSTGTCVYSCSITATNRIRVRIENNSSTVTDVPAGDWIFTVIKTSTM